MTTGAMLDYLQKKASSYSREELLQFLDEIVFFILSKDLFQTLKLDGSNQGNPPPIVTKNNKFEYEAPDDCARTLAVFSRALQRNFGSRNFFVRWRRYYYSRIENYEISTQTFDATETQNARIIFLENPGDSTDTYFHLYRIKIPRLVSENIEIPIIPPQHHLRVRQAVLALVREEEFGRHDAWEYIEREVARRIWDELNRGSQGRMFQTLHREEYREYGPFRNFI